MSDHSAGHVGAASGEAVRAGLASLRCIGAACNGIGRASAVAPRGPGTSPS
ncbi:hypothetical protein [Acrocarpospora macrocephala]|uniref:hypothetical protein n=1 Tax=Acrocarpospora TaxID=90974 RepID=UPI0012D2CC80|nr:hypothetical protein [Acrocarpospora macrocephala]